MISETMHIHAIIFQKPCPMGPTQVIKQHKETHAITFGSFVIAAAKCDCLRAIRIIPIDFELFHIFGFRNNEYSWFPEGAFKEPFKKGSRVFGLGVQPTCRIDFGGDRG